MTRLSLLAIAAATHHLHTLLSVHTAAQVLYAVNDPLLPDDAILFSGAQLQNASVSVCDGTGTCTGPLEVLLPTDNAIKVIAPTNLAVSSWNATLSFPGTGTPAITALLNLPTVSWWLSENSLGPSGTAVVGQPLRLYGKNLAWSPGVGCLPLTPAAASGMVGTAQLFAVPAGTTAPSTGTPLPLTLTLATCYRIDALPPTSLLGGTYDLWLSNGLGGPGLLPVVGARVAANVSFVSDPFAAWPPATFTVGSSPGCASVSACLLTAGAAGGGTVLLPAGLHYAQQGEALVFPAGAPVALVGAGKGVTELQWPVGLSMPKGAVITGNGTGPWRIADMTISVYAGAQPGAQPAAGLPLLVPQAGAVGVQLERVALIQDITAYPQIQAGNTLYAQGVQRLTIRDSELRHLGNCAAQWPHNTVYYLSNVSDVSITGSTFVCGCQGWSIASSSRVHVSDSSWSSVGAVSEGAGFNALDAPYVLQHIYYGNNTVVGNPAALMRWESMTYDGPGGEDNSSAVAVGSNSAGQPTLTLATPVTCRVPSAQGCLYAGMLIAIMRGPGTGQYRRVLSVQPDGVTVVLDAAFAPAPALGPGGDGNVSASYFTITGYRGQATYEGNFYTNGTCFQTYGCALDTIIAGNTLTEMFDTPSFNRTNVAAGLRMFGHRYVGGYEPNWRSIIERNQLTCITQFLVYADSIDSVVLSLGHTIRRNAVAGGVSLALNFVCDAVAEQQAFSAAYCAWAGAQLPAGSTSVNGTSPGTLVR